MNPTRLLLTPLTILLLLANAHQVDAQTLGKTALVPCQAATSSQTARVADRVETALMARRAFVISHHDARDRMLALSRPRRQPKADDDTFIKQETERALEHAAFGRTGPVKRSVDAVLARAESAVEVLNRDSSVARSILDACLALTRTLLHKGDRAQALQQTISCRRLVPDVLPDESHHPAHVIGLLAEADDQLRRLRVGPLHVQVLPEAACSVYANGRHMGTTPLILERMPPGVYHVEAECGDQRSRVHMVELRYDKPTELTIDLALDQSIVSDTRVALRGQGSLLQAATLGRSIRADDVILVEEVSGRFVLTRVNVSQGRSFARAELTGPTPADAELGAALDALLEGRTQVSAMPTTSAASLPQEPAASTSPTTELAPSGPAQSSTTSPVSPVPLERRSSSRRLALGVPLAALGSAILATALAFDLRAHAIGDELADGKPRNERQISALDDDYDKARTLSWVGASGGILIAVGMPWLVESRENVPWWSWTLGGAGLALAGVGAWQLATTNECADTRNAVCIAYQDTAARGMLLLSAGIGLVSVPVMQLLRRSTLRADVVLSASPESSLMGAVRGRY